MPNFVNRERELAASAHWATAVDGEAERERLHRTLAASPYLDAERLAVVARSGDGVTTRRTCSPTRLAGWD